MNSNQQKKIGKTVDYYDKLSKRYDRSWSAYLNHTHTRLLEQINILPGEKVLDISCGTGILAEELLKRYTNFELVLNDPADGMRSIAVKRLELYSNISFTNYTAEELQFESGSFDRIICLNSFHYYSDQVHVIEKIKNILKPGGTFYILDWNLQGWFHLPNKIISLLSPENINTKSETDVRYLLSQASLKTVYHSRWSYKFWKFFLIEAEKAIP